MDNTPDLSNSLNVIAEFAELPPEHIARLSALIKAYTKLPDRCASDDNSRKLRKELTVYYQELYKRAFFASLESGPIPNEVLMFFYFGYIDKDLAGEENAGFLYKTAAELSIDQQGRIFPFYHWLRMIYMGKKDPSINDFSVDYVSTVRKMKRDEGWTDDREIAELHNGDKRVKFELDNMFASANKMMTSRVSVFCPFFADHNIFKPLEQTLLTYDMLHQGLNVMRSIDYSLFYRETIYTNPNIGVQKQILQVEVLPDIILMPVVGERSSMWQEITGAKRTTPGRFILPIFEQEDVSKNIMKMCGEFRWELCRRVQGARWNDLSEHSLTSDYCDYVDTYKKNRELSPEAREKIKSALVKCRNSYKDMFTLDYITYILYESSGALRLNKVARNIMFTYCPFSKVLRSGVLSANPMYQQMIERHTNKTKHEQRLFDVVCQRIEGTGFEIPPEIKAYGAYLNM